MVTRLPGGPDTEITAFVSANITPAQREALEIEMGRRKAAGKAGSKLAPLVRECIESHLTTLGYTFE